MTAVTAPPFVMREVRWQDLEELARLETTIFGHEAWSLASWWGELAGRPRREYLLAEDEAGVTGYAGLDHGGEVSDVMTIAVVPRARGAGLKKVGVMVETPAAAIRAAQVLEEVDFASIGTNDLSQYTMAADRMQGELAELLSPWQPAVLSMIRETCRGGEATGKPVGVCGEAGGDPLMALVLVGVGVKSLSMAPGKVNAVRAALRLHDFDTCRQMANFAVDARTAAGAREAVFNLADPVLKDLL